MSLIISSFSCLIFDWLVVGRFYGKSTNGNLLSFFCLDVAQGHIKGAPNETRTHSCRFANGKSTNAGLLNTKVNLCQEIIWLLLILSICKQL